MKYKKLAEDILSNVGGKENINTVAHCVTRLRFKLKDDGKANTDILKKMDGVVTVMQSGGQYQVVIGNHVPDVFKDLTAIAGISLGNVSNDDEGKKGKPIDKFIDMVSGVFTPTLGVLAATGMIKGILALLVTLKVLSAASGTYQILYAVGDSFFYYLPILLGYTAAKKFNSNVFIGMTIGASLLYPALSGLSAAEPLYTLFKGTFIESPIRTTFLGAPVILMSYSSSVIPIILAVLFSGKVEKAFEKIIPDVVKTFLVPFFTLIIVIPLTFLVIGPVATWLGQGLGLVTTSIYKLSPIIAGAFIGGFWQVFVIFGLHWGLVPILFNNLAVYGSDPIIALTFGASFAQTGAVLAILLKTKDMKLKGLAIPSFISGIFGVTEPAIYGISLPRKKPFIVSCIGGAVGGAVMGAMGSAMYMFGGLGIFGLPSFLNQKTGIDSGFIGAVVGGVVVAFIVGLVGTYFFGFKDDKEVTSTTNASSKKKVDNKIVYSPLKGDVKALSETDDEAFASGALGKGVVIVPTEGKLVAPVNGIIATFFPTGHAIAIETEDGKEVLMHVGINTVELNGKFFYPKAKEGDEVTVGQTLLEFDIEAIKKAGYSISTPIIITNSDDFSSITGVEKKSIDFNEDLLTVIK